MMALFFSELRRAFSSRTAFLALAFTIEFSHFLASVVKLTGNRPKAMAVPRDPLPAFLRRCLPLHNDLRRITRGISALDRRKDHPDRFNLRRSSISIWEKLSLRPTLDDQARSRCPGNSGGVAVCEFYQSANSPLAIQLIVQQQAYEQAFVAAREEALRDTLSRLKKLLNEPS